MPPELYSAVPATSSVRPVGRPGATAFGVYPFAWSSPTATRIAADRSPAPSLVDAAAALSSAATAASAAASSERAQLALDDRLDAREVLQRLPGDGLPPGVGGERRAGDVGDDVVGRLQRTLGHDCGRRVGVGLPPDEVDRVHRHRLAGDHAEQREQLRRPGRLHDVVRHVVRREVGQHDRVDRGAGEDTRQRDPVGGAAAAVAVQDTRRDDLVAPRAGVGLPAPAGERRGSGLGVLAQVADSLRQDGERTSRPWPACRGLRLRRRSRQHGR